MKVYILIIAILLGSTFTNAQSSNKTKKTVSKSKFLLAATILNNYNNSAKDLDHWDDASVQGMNTDFLIGINQPSYQVKFGYEHQFNNRFTITPYLIYGVHKYSYKWNFTYDYFFAPNSTTTNYTNSLEHSRALPYAVLQLNLGYIYPLSNSNIDLEAKVGLSYLRFLRMDSGIDFHNVIYTENGNTFSRQYAQTDYQSRNGFFYGSLYLGMIYKLKTRRVKQLRLGIELMRSVSIFTKNNDWANLIHGIYYNSNGKLVSGDLYSNRFRNIAIVAGIGI